MQTKKLNLSQDYMVCKPAVCKYTKLPDKRKKNIKRVVIVEGITLLIECLHAQHIMISS